MNRRHLHHTRRNGSTTIEFCFTALALILVLLAGIEIDRLLLVYTTMSNSARIGARYAIVHGSSRTGTGADGPSGPSDNSQVVAVVRDYAGTGALTRSSVAVTVNYYLPNAATACSGTGCNDPGSTVEVRVSYPYDPLVLSAQLLIGGSRRVALSATTRGVITF